MMKWKLVLIVLLVLVGVGLAVSTYAICPIDGEQAMWSGQSNGTACKYAHDHYNSTTQKTVHHEFWQACGD